MNIRGELRFFDKSLIMGIMNLTPDSFFENSRLNSEKELLNQAKKMISEGADILDLGAYSSRPGAQDIPVDEEWNRLEQNLNSLRKEFPYVMVSVDTFRSEIAERAVNHGADIINDISGGELDDNMFDLIARLNVPYVLMHMKGNPANMQDGPIDKDAVQVVYRYFSEKLNQCRAKGIKDVVIDPGFGFGKSLEANYLLLKSLSEFQTFNCPILAGVSRKSMLNKVINGKAIDSLEATTAANTIALLNGANILRVHDVKAAKDAVQIVSFYQKV